MQHREELVDVRIEDGLADETERAVPDAERFAEAVRTHSGNALEHLDLAVMPFDYALKDFFRRVDFPAPGRADRVRAVPPAEDAFVRAAEGRRGFHA